jgi:cysteine desulfurase
MKQIIYFDHNATTPIRSSVKKLLLDMYEHTGNASSIHRLGSFMKRELEESRRYVAELLKVSAGGLTWTSCATESNNTVIRGYKGPVIISAIEHPSVYDVREDAIICPCDKNGIVIEDALEELLKQHPKALVCIMAANNEIGVVQDLEKLTALVHRYDSFIFSDCVQAFGKIKVPYSELDGFSLSGHKLGAPYGIGLLSIKSHIKIEPLLIGGGQERYKRSGTVNVYGALAFSQAMHEALKESWDHVAELRDYFESEMRKIYPELVILAERVTRLPNTSGLMIPGVLNTTQMMHYDLEGFCISLGAACSSGTIKTARILNLLQVPQELASCFIRISLGQNNTKEEVNQFLMSAQKLRDRRKYA